MFFFKGHDASNRVADWNAKSERSRGFGFITMRDEGDATEAIRQLNGIVRFLVANCLNVRLD
jgi:RNA recognition motif-containing protein